MLRNLILLFMFSFLCLLATGCVTLQEMGQPRPEFTSTPFEVTPPAVRKLADKDVPGHVRLVTTAIVKKMRQEAVAIPGVDFQSPDGRFYMDKNFDYRGFSVTDIIIFENWAKKDGTGKYDCKLNGILKFADHLGRRTIVDYTAFYKLSRQKAVISEWQVLPVLSVFPNTEAYFIHADKLQKITGANSEFPTFYSRVVQEAYSMQPTLEEIRERKALETKSFFDRLTYSSDKKREDIFMLIFVMDRLTPDAEVEVIVSEQLNGIESLAEPMFMDFNGWRVAVFGGNFALDNDKFYAKVYYKPARGILPEDREKVLIGLFDSEKNYGEKTEGIKNREKSSVAPMEGPLASGQRLLNISDNNDLALIQSRLAELGFYSMQVDGLWGPVSKAALKNFQMSNGLQPTAKWDMGTQMKLFAGTGR